MELKFKSHVLDVIKFRRSVRAFSPAEIEHDKLAMILEGARLAPSSNNTQPWHFILVKDKEMLKEISNAVPLGPARINAWIASCSALIVGCVIPSTFFHKAARILDKDYHVIDLAIAMENMVLVATDLGIGSCWVGWFDGKKISKLLDIPGNIKPVALLVLGYPEVESVFENNPAHGIGKISAKKRKSLESIVSSENYGGKLKA